MRNIIFILLFALFIASPPTNIGVCHGTIYTLNEIDNIEDVAKKIEHRCEPDSLKYAMPFDYAFCQWVEWDGIYKVIEEIRKCKGKVSAQRYHLVNDLCKKILEIEKK